MKEELTTKMHSELKAEHKDVIQQRCWSALAMINDIKDETEVDKWAEVYNVSTTDIIKHSAEYYKLSKKGNKP